MEFVDPTLSLATDFGGPFPQSAENLKGEATVDEGVDLPNVENGDGVATVMLSELRSMV